MSLNGYIAGILDAGGKVESLVMCAMGPIVGYINPPTGFCIKVKTPTFVGVVNFDGSLPVEMIRKPDGSYVLRNGKMDDHGWFPLPIPIEGGVVVATNQAGVTP